MSYEERIKQIKEKTKEMENEQIKLKENEEELKRQMVQRKNTREKFIQYIIETLEEAVERKQKLEKLEIVPEKRYKDYDDGLDLITPPDKLKTIFKVEKYYKQFGDRDNIEPITRNVKHEVELCIFGVESYQEFIQCFSEESIKTEPNEVTLLNGFLKIEYNVQNTHKIIATPNYA